MRFLTVLFALFLLVGGLGVPSGMLLSGPTTEPSGGNLALVSVTEAGSRDSSATPDTETELARVAIRGFGVAGVPPIRSGAGSVFGFYFERGAQENPARAPPQRPVPA
jgi:hypothetical protein